jgi:hypothetical protein
MLVSNFIILFVTLIILCLLYQRFQQKQLRNMPYANYDAIKKYLLNESDLAKSKKPIMWIHVPYEYNSRSWSSFGSRSNCDLNQPYLYLTVKSIINHCDESFTICIIDDKTFHKLIPGWNIDMSLISEPISCYVRHLALAKLIYMYGGMSVPISFLCFKDLKQMFETGTRGDTMFVCENVSQNITSVHTNFYPDSNFMGAKKECEILDKYIEFMERHISHDFTAQTKFVGDFDRWLNTRVTNKLIRLIPGKEVGTKTMDDEQVLVDDLLGNSYINFYQDMYGIWIPGKQILNRTKYEWFARLSPEQVVESNTIIGKYILLANVVEPNDTSTSTSTSYKKEGYANLKDVANAWEAPLTTNKNLITVPNYKEKPEWIGFWRTPLDAPVWGPMPQNLGNNVPKERL